MKRTCKDNYNGLNLGIAVLEQYSRFYYPDILFVHTYKVVFIVLCWKSLNFTLYFYGAYLLFISITIFLICCLVNHAKLEASVADMVSQLDAILLAYFFLHSNCMN